MREPRVIEIIRKSVDIAVSIILDTTGIFILVVPYAKLATRASTHSESTSNRDSNIVAYLVYKKCYSSIIWRLWIIATCLVKKREELDLRRIVLEECNLWYNIKRFKVNTKERGNHELLSIV